MENELLENLGRLHTTELGVIRIKKNLSLNVENVIEWCKEKISLSNAEITRKGKNWYNGKCVQLYRYHCSQGKMINFSIKELNAFAVIGQEVELTNYQKKNIQISTQFWRKFNSSLKKAYLSQSGNWVKYAFMERRNGKLYYFCSIPQRTITPEGFLYKEIPSYKYLVVEHIGAMDKIYETYGKIYEEIIPSTSYIPIKDIILHFEKYDYRFHWNSDNSVIEIWIPIQD